MAQFASPVGFVATQSGTARGLRADSPHAQQLKHSGTVQAQPTDQRGFPAGPGREPLFDENSVPCLTGVVDRKKLRVVHLLVLMGLVVSGCTSPAEPVEVELIDVTPIEALEQLEEEPRVAPAWEQSVSPADFSRCKLLDPRPASARELSRGQQRGDVYGRDNVGFPRTERYVPGLGVANIIFAKVSFADAPPSDLVPESFLREQTQIVSDWADYWSQGKLRYEFQVVEGWVEVPINHADYTVDPGVGDNEYDQDEFNRLMSSRMESVVQLVVAQLPKDLDYAAADGIFLYWSPEMFAFKQTISDNDGVFQTPQGRQQIPVQGGGVFQTTDTGSLTFEIKKEYAWTYFLHEFMHWQGMNGHAPGNGWKTGIGQGAYPGGSGEYSGAIAAWEVFLYEWWEESQVFCADLESFEDPQRVILSPLEVAGGERKMVAVRLEDYKVLVVESRRPIGWSETWSPNNSGLLVYEVDADGIQTDHVPNDCGNDPANPKWAYYLYPDHVGNTGCVPDDIANVMVREGDTLTYGGVKISLEFSDDERDFVLIERVDG